MRWLLALLLLFTAVFDGPSLTEMAGGAPTCGITQEHVAVEGAPDPTDGLRHSAVHFHAGQGPCGHVHVADAVGPAFMPGPGVRIRLAVLPPLDQPYTTRAIAPPDRPPTA
ncbi:hypothetical protein [Nitrospirillum sp. BR 11828]|uniref:hypothetical protein n=1 Tax=Nitrospirillum sp. BR 11828 TaxID=3104325 RepID=UPI002ACA848E|nr:hypothetical protein [Nitrospirillum sp. BR 11828]MDZ5645813.1 hypothetical protein [Nitrospirillum sp. BR 11828]